MAKAWIEGEIRRKTRNCTECGCWSDEQGDDAEEGTTDDEDAFYEGVSQSLLGITLESKVEVTVFLPCKVHISFFFPRLPSSDRPAFVVEEVDETEAGKHEGCYVETPLQFHNVCPLAKGCDLLESRHPNNRGFFGGEQSTSSCIPGRMCRCVHMEAGWCGLGKKTLGGVAS